MAPEFRKVALTCVVDRSCAGDGLDSSNVNDRPPFSYATNEGGGWAGAAAAANVGPSTLPEVVAAGTPGGVPVPPGRGAGAGAKGSTKPAAAVVGGCGCGAHASKQGRVQRAG